MDRFHRYFLLHRVLSSHRYPVPRVKLERELQCSKATVARIIDELRALEAPIEAAPDGRGYFYRPDVSFELPGIWFNASELYALLVAQQLLANVELGLLKDTLAPLRRKIDRTLALEQLGSGELPRRVRILRMAARGPGQHFAPIADALLARKRLAIEYEARSTNELTHREISPQRLTHYRDNWYLDAWCHRRKALRSFALERIRQVRPRSTRAKDVSDDELDAYFRSAYGIFGGAPKATAVLRFSARRARWVADEHWHGAQQGRFIDDGRYELQVPYADERELMLDILRHGAEVEVVAPAALRARVVEELDAARAQYQTSG